MTFYQHLSAFLDDYEPILWMTVITWVGVRVMFKVQDHVRARRLRAAGAQVRERLTVLEARRSRAEKILARIRDEEARLRLL